MHLYLNRYLGTPNITKSTLTLCSDEGEILLRCEAREPTYRDYAEPFRRHSFHCLPRGTHRCIVSSAPGNRICLRVVRVKGHRGTRLCVDPQRQFHLGTVLLGQADSDVKPPWRRLTGQRQLQEQYMALLLDHIDEDYFLHVDNTHCEETSE